MKTLAHSEAGNAGKPIIQWSHRETLIYESLVSLLFLPVTDSPFLSFARKSQTLAGRGIIINRRLSSRETERAVLFLLQENARKPCNVTPDTSLPDVTSGTGPDFYFRSRGF